MQSEYWYPWPHSLHQLIKHDRLHPEVAEEGLWVFYSERLHQSTAVVKFGRNGVPPPVSGVPPPEIAVPPPGNDVPSPFGGKSL